MTYQEWLEQRGHLYGLCIGGDDEGGSGDGGDGGSGDDGDDGDISHDDDDGDGAGDDGDDDGDGAGDGDDEEVTLTKKELKELRDENARHRREAKKREREEKNDKQKKAREQGQHETLAKEAEDERDAEKAAREAAEFELDQTRREIRVRDAASNLNFRESEDAIRFLTTDDTETPESTTRALKKLAEKKPYLLADRPRTGRGGGGGSEDKGLSRAEIEKMSPQEAARRMPEIRRSQALQRSGDA